jgi:hypothetical protein
MTFPPSLSLEGFPAAIVLLDRHGMDRRVKPGDDGEVSVGEDRKSWMAGTRACPGPDPGPAMTIEGVMHGAGNDAGRKQE